MKLVFLASKSDDKQLDVYLSKQKYKEINIVYDKMIDNINCDLIIISISPVSADSTLFQAAVLNTFKFFEKSKIKRLRFDNVKVPVGFGDLCDIEDWKI